MSTKKRVPDPTPEEIAERAAEVQRLWSDQEKANRRCSRPDSDSMRIDLQDDECD